MRSNLQYKEMENTAYKSLNKELSRAFTRPLYAYTSMENDYIDRLHADDWKKKRTIYDEE